MKQEAAKYLYADPNLDVFKMHVTKSGLKICLMLKKTSISEHEETYWSGAVPGLISVRDFVVDAYSFYCPLPCLISFPSGRWTWNFSLDLGSHTKTWKVAQGKEYPFQWPKRKDLLQTIPESKFFLGMVVHMLTLILFVCFLKKCKLTICNYVTF